MPTLRPASIGLAPHGHETGGSEFAAPTSDGTSGCIARIETWGMLTEASPLGSSARERKKARNPVSLRARSSRNAFAGHSYRENRVTAARGFVFWVALK